MNIPSGSKPGSLPLPLNNLNGVLATDPSQLESAFRSLQTAVGGRGALRTDFASLCQRISALELQYTRGEHLLRMVTLLKGDRKALIKHCEGLPAGTQRIKLDCGWVEQSVVQQLKGLEANELKGLIEVVVSSSGTSFGTGGAINGAQLSVHVDVPTILEFKSLLGA